MQREELNEDTLDYILALHEAWFTVDTDAASGRLIWEEIEAEQRTHWGAL